MSSPWPQGAHSGYLLLHYNLPQNLVVYKNSDIVLSHDFTGQDSPGWFVLVHGDWDLSWRWVGQLNQIHMSGALVVLYVACAGTRIFSSRVPSFVWLAFGLKWVEAGVWKIINFHTRWSQGNQNFYTVAGFPQSKGSTRQGVESLKAWAQKLAQHYTGHRVTEPIQSQGEGTWTPTLHGKRVCSHLLPTTGLTNSAWEVLRVVKHLEPIHVQRAGLCGLNWK